jgi:outer membrane immunogenic protein
VVRHLRHILFYGTFGLAYGDLKAENLGASETHTMAGCVGGAGSEGADLPHCRHCEE